MLLRLLAHITNLKSAPGWTTESGAVWRSNSTLLWRALFAQRSMCWAQFTPPSPKTLLNSRVDLVATDSPDPVGK